MKTLLKLDVTRYDQKVNDETLKEITELAEECKINEEYDKDCDITYLWRESGRLVAVISFRLQKFQDGRNIPRWEHIFYHQSVKTTKRAWLFIMSVVKDIKALGFRQLWALIKPERKIMIDYATKFGFKEFCLDHDGVCLYKNL